MSARSSRFSGFGSGSGSGKIAAAVVACGVMLLAGCGGSGEAESGAPVIRGDAPVAADAALTVSNTTLSGTVGTAITLTTAGGSGADTVTFAATGTTGCTVSGALLSATTAGSCIVTATQVTQTSESVTFSFEGVTAAATSTLTVTGTPTTAVVGTPISLTTSGGSGSGAVTFASSAGCTIDGTSLTATADAMCEVTATQGTQTANATFTFTAAALTVSNTTMTAAVNTAITLTTAGGSGTGAVMFDAEDGTFTDSGTFDAARGTIGCSVLGSRLTASEPGPCTVAAQQGMQMSTPVTFTFTEVSSRVPASPGHPSLTSTGPTTMTVRFDVPRDNGSVITSYTATSVHPNRGWIAGTVSGVESSSGILVTGLTTGRTYMFEVTATNAFGTSTGSYTPDLAVGSGDCKVRPRPNVNWAYCFKVGANLPGADLRGANLTGADLGSAFLKGTDFTGADLTGADLSSAYAGGANFTRANLKDADLRDAALNYANLTNAYIKGALLPGENWQGVTCPDGQVTREGYPCWASGGDWVAVRTVTFDVNGGSGSTADQSASTATALSKNTFTRTGYNFDGWATTRTGSMTYADGASYPFDDFATLYAHWVAVPSTSTVTFDANGGSGSLASQSASTAIALTLNADAIKRSGYGFDGWATTPTGSMAYADGKSYPFTASATLYARWLPTKTVTFSANLGTGTMANQASHVATALMANGFERKAYVFDGWATTATGKQAYPNGGSYPFTSDSMLYARWVCKPFAVTVNGAYGLGTTKASVNFETTSELPMTTVTAKTTTGGYSATKTTSALSGVIYVTGIVKNTAYKFKVTATNTAGCSSTNPGEAPFRK